MMDDKDVLIREKVDLSLQDWREKEKQALELQKLVGELRFDHSVELVLFRKQLYDRRTSDLLHNHSFSKNYSKQELDIDVTLALTKTIHKIPDLAPSKIDLGILGLDWLKEGQDYENIDVFVAKKLQKFIGAGPKGDTQKDIVLYGFGRIGRLAARIIIQNTGKGEQLRLKGIVIRPKLKDRYQEALKRASLLQTDTVHGNFGGKISVEKEGNELHINGNIVQLIYASSPSEIDYREYGIDNAMVIDNTGMFRDKEGLSNHLRPGVDQVMLTAPGNDIPNVVIGANQSEFDFANQNVFCAASCTTNAIVPALSVIYESFGIEKGHLETIHAFTNDQNLIDNFHKKPRRGRGAPNNMVITTTGAAKAVSKVIPELSGKLTGSAVRVPIPNVSIAILNLTLTKSVSKEELNAKLKEASLYGPLVEQIQYSTSTEFVSSNAIGMTSTCVVDAPSTLISQDGKTATIYLWYDNEYGYTCQVVRLAKYAAKVRRHSYN